MQNSQHPYYDSDSSNGAKKFCRFFDRGNCTKRDQCPMVHQERQPSHRPQYQPGHQQSPHQQQGSQQRHVDYPPSQQRHVDHPPSQQQQHSGQYPHQQSHQQQHSGQPQYPNLQGHQVRPAPQHHQGQQGYSQTQQLLQAVQHGHHGQPQQQQQQHGHHGQPQQQQQQQQQYSGSHHHHVLQTVPHQAQTVITGPQIPQRCRFFDRGNCAKGDQCPLIHQERLPPAQVIPQQNGVPHYNLQRSQFQQPPQFQPLEPQRCRYFDRGNCTKGDICPMLHLERPPQGHSFPHHPFHQPQGHHMNTHYDVRGPTQHHPPRNFNNNYNTNSNYNNTNNNNINNRNLQRIPFNSKDTAFHRNKTELSLMRKRLPDSFPRGPAFVCWKYIVPGAKNQRCPDISGNCPNGVHDENAREEFMSSQRSKAVPLYDTEPGSIHPNFQITCVCCDRLLVRGEDVHCVTKNSVMATKLEASSIFISPHVVQHPIKLHNTQSVFCICSRWVGDFLEDYVCTETGEKVEYKVEVINRAGEATNTWRGSQDDHTISSDKPHKKWQSEKREVDNLVQ
jgi:hypothetical protein